MFRSKEILHHIFDVKYFVRNYKYVFFANCLIALLLAILEFSPNLRAWLFDIGESFVFSQCIGTSIYFVACLSNFERIRNQFLRLLTMVTAFVVGGWIGMLMGWGLNHLLFGFRISPGYVDDFFLRITLFNLFMSILVFSFLVLREKLQDTATRLAEKEVSEQRLLRLKTKAELEALRAKINPHFLFNTLNSIASLIPEDPEKAEEMLQKLSHLFRYTLDASNRELMRLSEELQVVEEYLEIEKVRIGSRLDYEIECDATLAEMPIPSLLLQPLVENSVKHGIAPMEAGGKIIIKCVRRNRRCHIEISDNGGGLADNSNGRGFGLQTVKDRLSLYYGDTYLFELTDKNGVTINMSLPIDQKAAKNRNRNVLPNDSHR